MLISVRASSRVLFQASALGAIPVIVGDDAEIDSTFKGIGGSSRPPWLYAATWEDAAEMVAHMSQNETVARRRVVLRWWIDIVSTIQSMIYLQGIPRSASLQL